MTEAAKGVVIAFQKEQGFGKVTVDGHGEMSFDAVVALAKPADLVAGAKVNVELGPSRIPGKTKITKLWLEGASSEPLKQG